MKAKAKAEELVEKFYKETSEDMPIPTKEQVISFHLYPVYMEQAKECALICVDEILHVLNGCSSNLITHQVKSKINYYWEVKQEINKQKL